MPAPSPDRAHARARRARVAGQRAGQHVDVRLTAEDGYQASRSYSIVSAPEHDAVELTIERLEDGEVSPYLVDGVIAGDQFEVRGPIGGPFTWSVDRRRSRADGPASLERAWPPVGTAVLVLEAMEYSDLMLELRTRAAMSDGLRPSDNAPAEPCHGVVQHRGSSIGSPYAPACPIEAGRLRRSFRMRRRG
jgi:hypothetical protein